MGRLRCSGGIGLKRSRTLLSTRVLLRRGGNLGSDLVFGLLVAVRDEAVEEAARSALRVLAVFLVCLFKLLVKVTSGLLIQLLVFVEVG